MYVVHTHVGQSHDQSIRLNLDLPVTLLYHASRFDVFHEVFLKVVTCIMYNYAINGNGCVHSYKINVDQQNWAKLQHDINYVSIS